MLSHPSKTRFPSLIALVVLASLLGFGSVCAPSVLLAQHIEWAPLFPLVRTAIEHLSLVSMLLLFASGALLGMLEPQRPLLLGLSTMLYFPILAMLEIAVDSFSHPHYVSEFFYYLLMSGMAIVGGYIGSAVKRQQAT